MARGRMIDKVIILSRKINAISEGAENLYYRIYVNTDDFGLFHADPKILKGQIYTLRSISAATIERRLNELIEIGLIKIYINNGEKYLEIVDFDKHQDFRKDYTRKYEYPKPNTKSYETVRSRTKSPSKLNEIKLNEIKIKTYGQPELDRLFEKWWLRYPKKVDKGEAKRKWLTNVVTNRVDPETLEDALTGYINTLNKNETPVYYAKHGKTFLYPGNKAKKIPPTWEQFLEFADPKYRAKPPM